MKKEKRDSNSTARANVLGVGISAIDIPGALRIVSEWISFANAHYVAVTGVHGVMEAQRDPAFKRILNRAGLVTPDGMPMVWMGRLQGFKQIKRVYGPDLMLALCEWSARKGYSNFFYGGGQGVADELANKLVQRFPHFKCAGTYTPPFRSLTRQEDREVVRLINKSAAQIVWVGLSTPKQERWMAEHRRKLEAPVLLGVGAAFDFHTGRIRQAPRWMQRIGMEWFFRLMMEPRRLWRRYCRNNPLFIMGIICQWLGLRRYSIEG